MIEMENCFVPLEGENRLIKFVGICLLVISCGMIGFYKSMEFSERLTNLTNLKWCFLLIQGELSYQPSPLPILFQRISEKMDRRYKHIFCQLAQELQKKEEKRFSEIWREVWIKAQQNLAFQKEDTEVLLTFGETFGYLDRETQIRNIEYLITQVEEQMKDAKEKKQSGQKLYQTLGIVGGFFLAILFT